MTNKLDLGERKTRRVVVPEKDKRKDMLDQAVIIPPVEALVTDAMSIIGAELAQYRAKVSRGVTLDLKEARAVQGYVDTLVRLSKESREAARAHDLSSLSNEELLQLATQLLAEEPK